MEGAGIVQVLGLLGLVGGAIGGAAKAWTMLRGIIRRVDAIDETAARVEQVAADVKALTEKELTPNGGSSLKDAMTRVERRLGEMEDRQLQTARMVEGLLGRLLRQGDRIDELEHPRDRQ